MKYKRPKDGAIKDVTFDIARPRSAKDSPLVIGNYIRMIMRDGDKTPIENVEDYMKLDSVQESLGDIEQFMYWQAKEPEGFEYEINGVKSFSLLLSEKCVQEGKYVNPARTDNPSDKYGHNYYVDGMCQKDSNGIFEQNDINLCPGICLKKDFAGRKIFEEVTGKSLDGVKGDCSVYCTGEELLDIYMQMLQLIIDELRKEYPVLETLEDNDTRIFGLIDVMYAGSDNFKIGTIAKKLKSGNLNLTKEDFLSNVTEANDFYKQNPEGLKRRRLMDYYIYAEGKYGHNLYGGSGEQILERYEFFSESPFQDLMIDVEGAKVVKMEN